MTKISSVGKWVPLYDDEYDGEQEVSPTLSSPKTDAGEAILDKDRLPWQPGTYELRLHHDGKHNVMSRIAPIEIIGKRLARHSRIASSSFIYIAVPKPPRISGFPSTRQQVMTIVALSLDLDEQSLPEGAMQVASRLRSGRPLEEAEVGNVSPDVSATSSSSGGSEAGSVPELDDFAVMEERHAKRIIAILKMAYNVEISMEMLLADPNVTAITRRILDTQKLAISTNSASG